MEPAKRRIQLQVRTLLMAVATVGLALGVWTQFQRLGRIRAEYKGEAYMCSLMEDSARASGEMSEADWLALCRDIERRNRDGDVPRSGGIQALVLPPPSPEVQRKRADHYAALRRKYELAARYPWLFVAPDPPEPE